MLRWLLARLADLLFGRPDLDDLDGLPRTRTTTGSVPAICPGCKWPVERCLCP